MSFDTTKSQIAFYDSDIDFIKAYLLLVLDNLNFQILDELISINYQMLEMEQNSLEKIESDNEKINIIMEEFKNNLVNWNVRCRKVILCELLN